MRATLLGETTRVHGALLVLLALAGCDDVLVFPCTDVKQCVRAGKSGAACVLAPSATSRYCAFTDLNCASSELRFDATAGEGLSDQCLVRGAKTDGGGPGDDLTMSVDDLSMQAQMDLAGPVTSLKWEVVNSGIGTDLWCVGGYDDMHVWVGGSGGLWFSGDKGKTWSRQALPMNSDSITGIYAVNRRAWIINHSTEIFYTSDDGAHWTKQSVPNNVQGTPLYAIWGSGPSNIFAAGEGGLMLHTSDGTVWGAQSVMGPTIGYLNAVWGSTATDVWSSGGSGVVNVNSPMAHTTNAGVSWNAGTISSDLIIFGIWGSGPTDIYAVGEQQVVYHSGGGAFTQLRKPAGPNDAFYGAWGAGADDIYLAGTSGTLVRSIDSGATWKDQASGTSADLTALWGPSRNSVYVVGVSGTLLHGTP